VTVRVERNGIERADLGATLAINEPTPCVTGNLNLVEIGQLPSGGSCQSRCHAPVADELDVTS